MSLGHKGQEIRQGCSDHRSPPPYSPSLQPPPIEHRRCCHIHDGVHLQFSAQITLEAHSNREQIFIQRFPSKRENFVDAWSFPLESSSLSLQFSTDNFLSKKREGGKLFIIIRLVILLMFQLVRTKTFPFPGFQFAEVASLGQDFSKMIRKKKEGKNRRGYIRRRGRNPRPTRRTKSGRTADKSLSILNWIWYFNSSCIYVIYAWRNRTRWKD